MTEPDDATKLHDMAIIIQRMRDIAYRVSCDGDSDRELRGLMHDIMDYAGMVWDGRASRHDKLSWEQPKREHPYPSWVLPKREVYAKQAEEAKAVVDSWPDSIKKNITPPKCGRPDCHWDHDEHGQCKRIHVGEPAYTLDAERFVWEPGDIHHLSDEEILPPDDGLGPDPVDYGPGGHVVGDTMLVPPFMIEAPTTPAPELQHTCGPPGQPWYHDDPHCARCMADNAAHLARQPGRPGIDRQYTAPELAQELERIANLPPQYAPDGCDASARRSSEAVTSEAETMENAEVTVSQADTLNRNVSFRANAYCKTCGLSMKLHPTTDGVGDCSAAFRAHLAARSQLFRHCS